MGHIGNGAHGQWVMDWQRYMWYVSTVLIKILNMGDETHCLLTAHLIHT